MANFDPLEGYYDRYYDTGAPYFYKARVPKAGTPLRNATLAAAMSLSIRYPFMLVKGVQQQVGNMKKVPPHKKFQQEFSEYQPGPKTSLPTFVGQSTPTGEPTKIWDMSKSIRIYLASEQKLIESGGAPYVYLDYIPEKLDFKAKADQRNIGVIGLNLPHYHYGGSESSVGFTIDWYDFNPSPGYQDRLVTRCKKIEVLTMADGFSSAPPQIIIDWYGSTIFKNKTFIVKSADLTFRHFSFARKAFGEQTKFNFLNPLYASQEVILSEVGPQQTHEAMIQGSIQ